jgi:hypothetical protein
LTEAAANAWDPDAENVEISIDLDKKIIEIKDDTSPNIEVIFILGKPIDEERSNQERLKSSMTAISPGSRIVHYDSLSRGAQEAYSEFLEKSEQFDKLERIVDGI